MENLTCLEMGITYALEVGNDNGDDFGTLLSNIPLIK